MCHCDVQTCASIIIIVASCSTLFLKRLLQFSRGALLDRKAICDRINYIIWRLRLATARLADCYCNQCPTNPSLSLPTPEWSHSRDCFGSHPRTLQDVDSAVEERGNYWLPRKLIVVARTQLLSNQVCKQLTQRFLMCQINEFSRDAML